MKWRDILRFRGPNCATAAVGYVSGMSAETRSTDRRSIWRRRRQAEMNLRKGGSMNSYSRMPVIAVSLAVAALGATQASAQVPMALAVPDAIVVATLHAEGAQVYECKPGPDNALIWQFREPVATLLQDGKTVGRHYAGPTWELTDKSTVRGKVAVSARGATPNDIALLKLDVTERQGEG